MKILFLFLALVVGTTSMVPARADRDLDSDTVRQWVEEGRILSLDELLERHSERLGGRLLDLEVEREDGRIVYELEMMDDDGRVREIYLDAGSGEWLSEEFED
jgi:uncharacterized membrane protein YkoI